MSRMLPLRGDREQRQICSECRKHYGDNMGRAWPFERYRDASGEMVSDPTEFELRVKDGVVQQRVTGPGRHEWTTFPGGTVSCADPVCSPDKIGNFRVFVPETGDEGSV